MMRNGWQRIVAGAVTAVAPFAVRVAATDLVGPARRTSKAGAGDRQDSPINGSCPMNARWLALAALPVAVTLASAAVLWFSMAHAQARPIDDYVAAAGRLAHGGPNHNQHTNNGGKQWLTRF
jgi:hypothetical protein